MRCGIARDLVTPALKTHMGGYGSLYKQHFTGIHDDLYVKAMVLDDGRRRVALVTLDLLFHDFALTEAVGDHLQARHGIPREHLILSYTHTHAGPALKGYDPGQHSEAYEAFLFDRITACLDRACVNTFEGEVRYGTFEGAWSMNRRRRADGKMVNAPNPEGDTDKEFAVLQVCDAQGETRALVLNYSCHPVTLGDTLWLSAEYPGRLCQLLEAQFYGCTAMFFQSAGGCTRPRVTAGATSWRKCSFDEVDDMACAMAHHVRKAICTGTLKPVTLDLAARWFTVTLETEVLPKDYFAQIVSDPNVPDSPHKNEARVVLERYDTTDNTIPLRAGLMRLGGDLYLAFLGGEVTWPVKQAVQKALEGKRVLFVGYGDAIAYIPGDRYIREGGYEVDGSVVEFCLKGRFKLGVDERVIRGFRAALAAL